MIDRSLLSRLPIPALIKLAALSHDEAVDRLRHAARLCLDGARSLAFEDQQQKDLADKLIEDALALYDLALQRRHPPPLSDSPAMVRINASTDAPSAPPTPWDDQFAQEIASGTRCAERWLERQNTQPLWWQLTQARIKKSVVLPLVLHSSGQEYVQYLHHRQHSAQIRIASVAE